MEMEKETQLKKFKIIEPFLRKEKKLRDIEKESGISYATLKRWIKAYKEEGVLGLDKKERQDKNSFRAVDDKGMDIIKKVCMNFKTSMNNAKTVHTEIIAQVDVYKRQTENCGAVSFIIKTGREYATKRINEVLRQKEKQMPYRTRPPCARPAAEQSRSRCNPQNCAPNIRRWPERAVYKRQDMPLLMSGAHQRDAARQRQPLRHCKPCEEARHI